MNSGNIKSAEKEGNGIPQERRKGIISYYEKTRKDYSYLWLNKENQGLHFGYYDEAAKDHNASLSNTNRVMADLAGISDKDIVLDAGCGQGGSSFWIAENRKAKVTGITVVPFQVDMAREGAKQRGIENLARFEVADYCSSPFADSAFTVIWACESVCHADEKIRFYKEAFRLLKPGGRLVMAEYIRKQRPLDAKGELHIHRWLDGWSIRDIDTSAEHEKNMKQAGFEDIQIQDITPAMKPSLRRLYRMSEWLYPLGALLRGFRILNEGTFRNQTSSIHLYKALERGDWFYGLISCKKPG